LLAAEELADSSAVISSLSSSLERSTKALFFPACGWLEVVMGMYGIQADLLRQHVERGVMKGKAEKDWEEG